MTSRRSTASAEISFLRPTPNSMYGVAVQNIGAEGGVVLAELVEAGGAVVAATELAAPSGRSTVRLLSDLFGAACGADCTVRITSALFVRVLGVVADQLTGATWPIAPVVVR